MIFLTLHFMEKSSPKETNVLFVKEKCTLGFEAFVSGKYFSQPQPHLVISSKHAIIAFSMEKQRCADLSAILWFHSVSYLRRISIQLCGNDELLDQSFSDRPCSILMSTSQNSPVISQKLNRKAS